MKTQKETKIILCSTISSFESSERMCRDKNNVHDYLFRDVKALNVYVKLSSSREKTRARKDDERSLEHFYPLCQ